MIKEEFQSKTIPKLVPISTAGKKPADTSEELLRRIKDAVGKRRSRYRK